jgi:hypothetical protein
VRSLLQTAAWPKPVTEGDDRYLLIAAAVRPYYCTMISAEPTCQGQAATRSLCARTRRPRPRAGSYEQDGEDEGTKRLW